MVLKRISAVEQQVGGEVQRTVTFKDVIYWNLWNEKQNKEH